MATTSDIHNGMVIDFKNDYYEVVDFLHVKPGKGGAFVRTKLKSLRTGQVLENTFRTSEKLTEIKVEKKKLEYLYNDGSFYVFMDSITFEQIQVPGETVQDIEVFLTENMEIVAKLSPDEEILGIELPTTVIQEIAECEPNVKGNTASGSGKSAITDKGLRITVPFFVEIGNKIKIDTRTGDYLERA
ncbi:MAG: elongation factor P [Candidatus Cloacimonetes bacterium]|nr:elongation factor P [Candidatus Cloacimonadota bacterium]